MFLTNANKISILNICSNTTFYSKKFNLDRVFDINYKYILDLSIPIWLDEYTCFLCLKFTLANCFYWTLKIVCPKLKTNFLERCSIGYFRIRNKKSSVNILWQRYRFIGCQKGGWWVRVRLRRKDVSRVSKVRARAYPSSALHNTYTAVINNYK